MLEVAARGWRVFRSLLTASERRIVAQSFWVSLAALARTGFGLAAIPLLVRIVGLDGYGILSSCIALCTLAHSMLTLPSESTLLAFAARNIAQGRQEEANSILRFTLYLSCGSALLAYAALVLISFSFASLFALGGVYQQYVLILGLLGVLNMWRQSCVAVLRLSDRIYWITAAAALSNTLKIILLLLTLRERGGVAEAAVVIVVCMLVEDAALIAAAARSLVRAGFAGVWRRAACALPSGVLPFYAWHWAHHALNTLAGTMDILLVAYYAGAGPTGMYQAAVHMLNAARQPFWALSRAVFMEYSRRAAARDGVQFRRIALKATLLATLAAVIGFTALLAARDTLAQLLFGEDFHAVGELTAVMIPAAALWCAACGVISIPDALGRWRPGFWSAALASAAALALLLLLAPQHGAAAAAWAYAVLMVIQGLAPLPCIIAALRQTRVWRSAAA